MPDSYPLKPRPSGWLIALCLLVLAVVLFVGAIWWESVRLANEARDTARSVAAEFQKAFNFTPEVRVNTRVIVAATTPALELVTVQKQMVVTQALSDTWLHSTKNFEIEAVFTARAGFDLTAPFRLQINSHTHAVSMELPPPKLLSLSMGDIRILRDEDGLWNKITSADREQAMRNLEQKAREQFLQTALLKEARQEGEKRLKGLLGGNQVTFSESPRK